MLVPLAEIAPASAQVPGLLPGKPAAGFDVEGLIDRLMGDPHRLILREVQGQAPSEAQVLAALDGKLARFKQPKRVIVVPELPRNAMGKVQKAALRARHAGLFGGAG